MNVFERCLFRFTFACLPIFGFGVRSLAAGGIGTGGGVGYQCPSGVSLADTYAFFTSPRGVQQIKLYQTSSVDEVVDLLLQNQADYLQLSLGDADVVRSAERSLRWTEISSVPATNDSHIESAPCAGGAIIQLARQDENGLVQVSPVVKAMSVLEQALLRVHEARVRILLQSQGLNGDTTGVRSWVSSFARLGLASITSASGSGNSVRAQQDFPLPRRCFRGKLYSSENRNGGIGIYDEVIHLPNAIVNASDIGTTPGVEGEPCPPPALKPLPSPGVYKVPTLKLALADRLKINPVQPFLFNGQIKLIDRATVGSCVISANKYLGGAFFHATVEANCTYFDEGLGREVSLYSDREIDLEIPMRKITGFEASSMKDLRYFDVDAPLIIAQGAFAGDGGVMTTADELTGNFVEPNVLVGQSALGGYSRGPKVKGTGVYDRMGELQRFFTDDAGINICVETNERRAFCVNASRGVNFEFRSRYKIIMNMKRPESDGFWSGEIEIAASRFELLSATDLAQRCGPEGRRFWQMEWSQKFHEDVYFDVCSSTGQKEVFREGEIRERNPGPSRPAAQVSVGKFGKLEKDPSGKAVATFEIPSFQIPVTFRKDQTLAQALSHLNRLSVEVQGFWTTIDENGFIGDHPAMLAVPSGNSIKSRGECRLQVSFVPAKMKGQAVLNVKGAKCLSDPKRIVDAPPFISLGLYQTKTEMKNGADSEQLYVLRLNNLGKPCGPKYFNNQFVVRFADNAVCLPTTEVGKGKTLPAIDLSKFF